MRLASGFFASLPNFRLEQHPACFKINTPANWHWYFLRRSQVFLVFQDPVHLVTKWRNRLLSSIATLRLGDDDISMKHIEELIKNNSYTKLDHCLTKSDLNPKDRQNYNSCVKLVSSDVINLLENSSGTNGTIVYLKLLKMIIRAYIDKTTSIRERECILISSARVISRLLIVTIFYSSRYSICLVCRVRLPSVAMLVRNNIISCVIELCKNKRKTKGNQ